jgi:hypothetical protein
MTTPLGASSLTSGQRLLQATLLDALVAGKVVGEALDGDEHLVAEALR